MVLPSSTDTSLERSVVIPYWTQRASESGDIFEGLLLHDEHSNETQVILSFNDRTELQRRSPYEAANSTVFEHQDRQLDMTLYKMNPRVARTVDSMTNLSFNAAQVDNNIEAMYRRRMLDVINAAKGSVVIRTDRDSIDDSPANAETFTAAEDGVISDPIPPQGEYGVTSKRIIENLAKHKRTLATMKSPRNSPSHIAGKQVWVATTVDFASVITDTSGGTATPGVMDYEVYREVNSFIKQGTFHRPVYNVMSAVGIAADAWLENAPFSPLDFDGVIEDLGAGVFELIRNTFIMSQDGVNRYANVVTAIDIRQDPQDPFVDFYNTQIWSGSIRVKGNRIRILPVRELISADDAMAMKFYGIPIRKVETGKLEIDKDGKKHLKTLIDGCSMKKFATGGKYA